MYRCRTSPGSLAASQDESTWVLTSYLVANGIVLPLSGWLSNVMGRKNFFMLCIGGFTVASFACGVATSLPMLIAFRLVQGLAGGGLQPTQQAIIIDTFPIEKRGTAFAITGITMIVAPILGPTLGGYITDNFSWRWIFYMNVPVGAFALFMVSRVVEDPAYAKAKGLGKIDYIGLGLIALALAALQIVLDKGQEDDWFNSDFILSFSVISGAAFIAALLWILPQEDPVVDLKLLRKRSFGLACLMIFFVGFALYGSSALLPLLTQSQFGYDATLSGLVLSPGGFAVIILMPVVGKLVAKIQPRYLILLWHGLGGVWHVSDYVSLHRKVITGPSCGCACFRLPGCRFCSFLSVRWPLPILKKKKGGKASALYSLMRNLGGSIGISILSFLCNASYATASEPLWRHICQDQIRSIRPCAARMLIILCRTARRPVKRVTALWDEFISSLDGNRRFCPTMMHTCYWRASCCSSPGWRYVCPISISKRKHREPRLRIKENDMRKLGNTYFRSSTLLGLTCRYWWLRRRSQLHPA